MNRSATHLSLLALYAMGGHLVNSGLLPVGVLVTAIGFTFSLVFATQVWGWGWAAQLQLLSPWLPSITRAGQCLSDGPS